MNHNGFNSHSRKKHQANNYSATRSKRGQNLDLGEHLSKLKRRWIPATIVFLATVGGAVLFAFSVEDSYKAEGKLLFNPNTTIGTDPNSQPNRPNNSGIEQISLNNEIQKITTSAVLQETINQLELTDETKEPLSLEEFSKNLKVKAIQDSEVIEITYSSENPEVAAKVVNALMSVYIQEQIRNNQVQPANAKEFIASQIPEIEATVSTAESELEKFRSENQIIDLAEEKKIIVQEIGSLNRDFATVGATYQGKQAQAKALQNQLGLNLQQAVAVNQLGNSPVVQSILQEIANTETELAAEKQRFTDNHPIIESILEKKANLRQELSSLISKSVGNGVKVSDGLLNGSNSTKQTVLENFINLKVEELSLQQQLSSIEQSRQSYIERASVLPTLEQKEAELLRKADTVNKTYTALLDSLQQIELDRNQQTANLEIIETANAPQTASSNRMAIILLGIVLGLILSNLTAVGLENRDRTIKGVAEVKKKLPFKVLGMIPQVEDYQQQGVLVTEEPDSYISELYRMLQANLKFMTQQQSPKVILVTSSVPGEGKSTITANLGAAIAQLGRHVLLIDGDLRKPSQDTLWNVSDFVSLTEVIKEQKPLASAICQPIPKLDLLLADNNLSNPLAFLDSPEMTALIDQGRKTYDLVLIDAPPLPISADVLTLSKMVDGILFVSRIGVAENESVELAKETLDSMGSNVLGMVINGVKNQEFEKYSYSSKYGKRYFDKGSSSTKSSKHNQKNNSQQLTISTASYENNQTKDENKDKEVEEQSGK